MVFTSTKASKAILLGESKEADDMAADRAKWIILELKKTIPLFPMDSPDNSGVEGLVNTFTAMIEIRLEEFGVNIGNFMSLLGLTGFRKKIYEAMALPFAMGTMAKGGPMTTTETNRSKKIYAREVSELIQRRNGMPHTNSSRKSEISNGGKKKGKRKSKKKR